MYITIRLDDITPDMDWSKFNTVKEILDKHQVKPLIGIVPDNGDSKLKLNDSRADFWDYVKELQDNGWTVAMHGLNHLYTTKKGGLFPLNMKSEFAGLDYATQDSMIKKGKEILESHGIHTDMFMAPSHSYDKNTLKALKANGFTKVTDGFGKKPYKRAGITFYPISMQKSKSIKDSSNGITTFVYHANTMECKDFQSFEKLFEKTTVVSYSDFFEYNIESRNLFSNISEYLLAKTKYLLVRYRK